MHVISTDAAPRPVAAYSQAIEFGGLVFTAGQIGTDPQTGGLVEGVEAQATRCLDNIAAILSAASLTFSDVLKISFYLTDMSHFGMVNSVYERYVGDKRPARTAIGVATLPLGALLEVDAIAGKSKPPP